MKTAATAKFVKTSPRKLAAVAAGIRGTSVAAARLQLGSSPRRAAGPLAKTLESAVANAENNFNLKAANLRVETVLVGAGPTLKRIRPRARGNAAPIKKRWSHITVIVEDSGGLKTAAQVRSKAETVVKSTDKTAAKKPAATKPAAKKETKNGS